MKKTFFLTLSLLFIFSCSKDKKAKDIVVTELNTPCECVNSLYIVALEINALSKSKDKMDSSKYQKDRSFLESIMSSIDNKCIIYEGGDSLLKPCENYQKLQLEMETYFYE